MPLTFNDSPPYAFVFMLLCLCVSVRADISTECFVSVFIKRNSVLTNVQFWQQSLSSDYFKGYNMSNTNALVARNHYQEEPMNWDIYWICSCREITNPLQHRIQCKVISHSLNICAKYLCMTRCMSVSLPFFVLHNTFNVCPSRAKCVVTPVSPSHFSRYPWHWGFPGPDLSAGNGRITSEGGI